ncbi:lytic transglycosylase domain-containing protein [Actinoplanes sp. NEAU-A12]|uniref:Lytic transglycosylase domain-containing protein n=1 Tax=Actinoplanes sandaracinus TaxID=3045177 RepID=A0ABT6X003_9ACTN|nr:lytic transglycosylase domain-containing protein [Actinoplanes sandaracinus]MDI6105323.1 lytic transglycosylase domain-containing protein [Actinoplanes sandaracinus]
MNRLRGLSARAASVALLLAGLAGGVHLGQQQTDRRQSAVLAGQEKASTERLLAQRQAEHAAARAARAEAEQAAARKATAVAQTAAADARALETAQRKVAAEKKAAAKRAAATGPVPYAGTIPDACADFSGSRAIGCALTLKAGLGIGQFSCLNKLWDHESGWNYKATNRSSGAYGIPQAYPGSKMASAGSDWRISPATQITWGLGYIKGRYSTPCGAWSHFQSAGSY